MPYVQRPTEVLPHEYPFVYLDRILAIEKGVRGVGVKNVTSNEYFFPGHFRSRPMMPGVLVVESLAQLTGVVLEGAARERREEERRLSYLARIRDMKFRRLVEPGDQLVLFSEIGRRSGSLVRARVRAEVDGKVAAEGEIVLALDKGSGGAR